MLVKSLQTTSFWFKCKFWILIYRLKTNLITLRVKFFSTDQADVWLRHVLFPDTLRGQTVTFIFRVQMGFVADCWAEQFKSQRINLLKILQGSEGPLDAPEDGWQRLQWERSIRGRTREAAPEIFPSLWLATKQHMSNILLYNMKGF